MSRDTITADALPALRALVVKDHVGLGGLPAARVGDMATCAGPPDMIVKGEPTVLIGP